MGDEGGKNADYKSIQNSGEQDPLDDVPTPTMNDFDDGVNDEERRYYLEKFHDIKNVKRHRLHCTACNKHLGLLTRHINRYRMHPLLKALVCISCQDFYNSGEFEKGEDGSELYCRWCGQGGQVYCCSKCPIVFCEKCINRNFGASKINEIESNDDWLCFSCNPKPLWLLRARFWVLIIYCTFKNNQAQNCTDPVLKATLLRKSQVDESECCKKNIVRKPVTPVVDKRKQSEPKKAILDSRPILPSPDQKKTLSINEARQAIKRLGSPVSIKKVTVPSNPVSGGPLPMKVAIPALPNHLQQLQAAKRIKMNMPTPPQMSNRYPMPTLIRTAPERKPMPQPMKKPPPPAMFNGYSISQGLTPGMREAYTSVIANDNLNLSLDSLTQGIDLSNVAQLEAAAAALEAEAVASANEPDEEDVAPPPLPNTTAKNTHKDDDVQCLTPKAVVKPAPPMNPRSFSASLPSSAFNNIIQMTENDVTINEVTGGLKFKVDPSTLSSSKMYKLPDGRIFAVNHNPTMPGGYSATIVAVDEASLRSGAPPPRGRVPPRLTPRQQSMNNNKQQSTPKPAVTFSSNSTSKMTTRSKVFHVDKTSTDPSTVVAGSVEWFKFNIVDAIDVMNYVLYKLNKLKNSSPELRNKSVSEIKDMHQNFDQMLKTSCRRFTEVRDNLNQGFKNWLKEKNCSELFSDDEDDIQILPDDISVSKGSRRGARKGKISNNEPITLDEDSNDSFKISDKDEEDDVKETSTGDNKESELKESTEKEAKDVKPEEKQDTKEKEAETSKEEDKETEEPVEDKEASEEQTTAEDEQSTKAVDTSATSNEEEMQGVEEGGHTDKDHSIEEADSKSEDADKSKEEAVVANGKEEDLLEGGEVINTKLGDDSVSEDMIDMLLDDTNATDKDVDMEDLQNPLEDADSDSGKKESAEAEECP